ncbi:MAG: ATP-binding cassette domain-containing protein [Deltaproteobacteria bacterium]|nr:ATP-binding cassette domain-containing protein [Deltaproteobacteria bacterium]
MSDIIIKAENIGKKYTIGHQRQKTGYTALRDVLMQNARTFWSKTKDMMQGKPVIQGDTLEEVWALSDVTFQVRRGEAIGIIGRNGAGKSTLLKILSRITEPSAGRLTLNGRVASLLEVGTGFHPELSGRENIYLNGTILGMTRREINRKFDEIVAFADVEKYLDTPVKRYSSGMYVRLAFAVAAHLEPEILVIDEVLAVGDAQFQKKCLGKMGDAAKEGRTVLFVSHNMSAVMGLCESAMMLDSGRVALIGPVKDVISRYTMVVSSENSLDLDQFIHGGAGSFARLKLMSIFNQQNKPASTFSMGSTAIIRLGVSCIRRMENFEIGVKISSWAGIAIHYIVSTWEGLRYDLEVGEHVFEVEIPNIKLLPGKYLLGAWVLREGNAADDHVQEITTIEIVGSDINGCGADFERYAYSGCEVYTPSHWTIVKTNNLMEDSK